jgi:signal transduction histidine kinase
VSRVPRGESLDRLVAACLFVAGQIQVWAGDTIPGPKGAIVPLVLVVTGAVAVRRRAPLAIGILVLCGFAALLLVAGSVTAVAVGIAWICAVYGIAVWTDTRGFVIGCACLAATSVVGQFQPNGSVGNAVTFTVVPGVAMLIARRAIRERELRAQAFAERAALLERERELHAREAVADERARIARELHDLVAHHVSVMVVQAGAERHALGSEQPGTREALGSIEQAGRQALAEARRLLGMLRRSGEDDGLDPQPGLEQIDVLVDHVERAGLPVTVTVEGDRVALPAGVDLCAYRVIQEGLTNALKHAGPACAQVRLRYVPEALDIEVRDDGRGAGSLNGDGAGHGLIGMRERVALYGGQLETGPGERGGFRVRARIPLA